MVKSIVVKMLVITIFLALMVSCKTNLSCVNPSGDEVDWSVILTFPKTSHESGKLNYGYFDHSSKKMSYHQVDKVANFPPVHLTSQLNKRNNVKGKEDTNYFVWNDDMTIDDDEKKSSMGKAHSKGILAYDSTSGFYLVHSLPRFPYRKGKDFLEDLPDNTGIYAQSFLCISLKKDEEKKVIEDLLIINPQLIMKHSDYKDFVDDPQNDNVIKLLKNRGDSNLPDSSITDLKSKKQMFTIFSKGKDFDSLPWDSLIPKYYKQTFHVETWTKPDRRLKPLCSSGATVYNVEEVKFGEFEYTSNNEHSKWGTSTKTVCIGDLNRTGSQLKRGGLVICLNHTVLAKIFMDSIVKSQKCSKNLKFME